MSGQKDEKNDPEASYRLGYQHGVQAALEAVKRSTTDKLERWVKEKIPHWRYHDRHDDRSVPPPEPN